MTERKGEVVVNEGVTIVQFLWSQRARSRSTCYLHIWSGIVDYPQIYCASREGAWKRSEESVL